jgi:hypothetical protein
MEPMLYTIAGIGVAGIYCVYSHYYRDRINKFRALRRRVTYMLWKAARKAE